MTGLFEGADNGRAPETRDRKPDRSEHPRACRGCGRTIKPGEFCRFVSMANYKHGISYDEAGQVRQAVFCRACLAGDYKILDTVFAMLGPRTHH